MRIRVFEGSFVKNNSLEAVGTILKKDKEGILIKCTEDAYLIKTLQFPGSKAMPVHAFINGGKSILSPGDILQAPAQEENS